MILTCAGDARAGFRPARDRSPTLQAWCRAPAVEMVSPVAPSNALRGLLLGPHG